jgi:hypothetical protein
MELEEAVNRYLNRLGRRYGPVVAGLAVLALVVATVASQGTTTARTPSRANQVAAGSTAAAANAVGSAGAAGTAGAATGGAVGGAAGTTGTGAVSGVVGGTAVSGGTTPVGAATGVDRAGVTCGAGVRQVPWSKYAPMCVPTFTGSNGGATSYCVTGDTIAFSFRRTNSAEEKATFAIAGSAQPGTDDQYLHDLNAYVSLFNKSYELYGRHVVIKPFTGQGDNLQEDQGQDLGGAQADAATAHDLGVFGDLTQSPALAMTQPYGEDLAHEHIVVVGGLGMPKSWHEQYAPYEYSVVPDGTTAGVAAVDALCRRAVGLPAEFAGDPTYQNKTRAFGLVTPDNPVYMQLGDLIQNGLKACGANVAKRVSYTINVANMGQQAVGVIAQMRVSGVTTVMCACDPVFEIFISNSAHSQNYYPEWFVVPWLDPIGRQDDQTEWAHAISAEGTYPPKLQSEAYKVYKLADPNGEPAEKYYAVAYFQALYTFDVLQQAGPNLNPYTFEHGAFSLPKSEPGDFGTWSGGQEAWSPATTAQVGYWDPNAISNMDGVKGAWISCENGQWFNIFDPNTWGAAHTQPHCFGK